MNRPPRSVLRLPALWLTLILPVACGNTKPLASGAGPDAADQEQPDAAVVGGGGGGTGGTLASDASASVVDGSVAAPDVTATASDAAPAPADTAPTPDGPPSVAACKLPEKLPLTGRMLANVPLVHDFAFDRAGNLIAVEMLTQALRSTPYQGAPTTLAPAFVPTPAYGTRFLPDGTLAIATSSSVIAVDPQFHKTNLATGLTYADGLAIDRQGRLYVATQSEILRIDGPGKSTVVSKDARPHGSIAFSPSYDTLYVTGASGEIRKLSVASDGKLGPEQPLAVIPKDGGDVLLFGIAIDECGNLYVAQGNNEVWQVTPAGALTKIVEINHGVLAVHFGSGLGGWKDTALYVALSAGGGASALELDLGFRGMSDPYLAAH